MEPSDEGIASCLDSSDEGVSCWRDIAYQLFLEGELNVKRCQEIMNVYRVDADALMAALITKYSYEDIGDKSFTFIHDSASLEIVSLSNKLHQAPITKGESSEQDFIDTFKNSITLFIPVPEDRTEPVLAEEPPLKYDTLTYKQAEHYCLLDKALFPGSDITEIDVYASRQCVICNIKYYVLTMGFKHAVCLDCVHRLVRITTKAFWNKEKCDNDPKGFMAYLRTEKFDTASDAEDESSSKRKRKE